MLGSGVRSHILDLSLMGVEALVTVVRSYLVVRSRDAPRQARLIHSHFRASRPLVGLVSLLVRR